MDSGKETGIARCGGLASHVGIDMYQCMLCRDFVKWCECWMNDSCSSHTTYLTCLPIHGVPETAAHWISPAVNFSSCLCWSLLVMTVMSPSQSLLVQSFEQHHPCDSIRGPTPTKGNDTVYTLILSKENLAETWFICQASVIQSSWQYLLYSYPASATNMYMRVDVYMSCIDVRTSLFSSACLVLNFWLQKESTVRTKFGTTYSTFSLYSGFSMAPWRSAKTGIQSHACELRKKKNLSHLIFGWWSQQRG